MSRFSKLGGLVGAAVVALGTLAGGAAPARAGDYCRHYHYEWVTCYKSVVCYETRQVPYTKAVCLYDHCGRPYYVDQTCYRDVRVEVAKSVPYRKQVVVYDN